MTGQQGGHTAPATWKGPRYNQQGGMFLEVHSVLMTFFFPTVQYNLKFV